MVNWTRLMTRKETVEITSLTTAAANRPATRSRRRARSTGPGRRGARRAARPREPPQARSSRSRARPEIGAGATFCRGPCPGGPIRVRLGRELNTLARSVCEYHLLDGRVRGDQRSDVRDEPAIEGDPQHGSQLLQREDRLVGRADQHLDTPLLLGRAQQVSERRLALGELVVTRGFLHTVTVAQEQMFIHGPRFFSGDLVHLRLGRAARGVGPKADLGARTLIGEV